MKQHYSIMQVASLLHVHRNTVARWLREGVIKGVKIGGTVRISEVELQRVTR